MNHLCLFCIAVGLCSCNTSIGLGRDMREGYHWSKRKIEESRQQRQMQQQQQQEYQYGAPVY